MPPPLFMPVHEILKNDLYIASPRIAQQAVLQSFCYWWLARCVTKLDKSGIQSASGIRHIEFSRYENLIFKMIEELLPVMQKHFDYQKKLQDHRIKICKMGAEVIQRKKLERQAQKIRESGLLDAGISETKISGIVPAESKWREGFSDKTARRAIIKSNKANKNVIPSLFDKC